MASLPSGEKLLDRYGLVASRWVAAERAGGDLPVSWLLDKKGFRRALGKELPPAHEVVDIADDARRDRRASRAARAYERTLSAARGLELPALPSEARRVLLWTSPVVRPRGVELPFLVQTRTVDAEPEAIFAAIGELWASVYFAECLREILRRSLKRVELATGLSVLPEHESAGQASFMELLLAQEPARAVVPVPGRLSWPRAASAIETGLGEMDVVALQAALTERFRRVPDGLFLDGSGGWELDVEKCAALIERRARHEGRALSRMTGIERGLGTNDVPPSSASRLSLARTVAKELLRQGDLGKRIAAHDRKVQAARGALMEMDLTVLPDDGLKRTLEDAATLLRENSELASESLVSAELLIASGEQLVPESTLLLDAGLEGLTALPLLSAWEERLEVVRNDAACAAALRAFSPLPDGPGRRALLDAERVLSVFAGDALSPNGEAKSGTPPTWLKAAARLGLERRSISGTACREARFAADRRLAGAEAHRAQWLGLSLSAVRSLSRDAVLVRETARLSRFALDSLMGRIVEDVDRRLRRIEPELPSGAAFDCTLDELIEAVDLRGSSLLARVLWRRSERLRQSQHERAFWTPSDLTALRDEPREPHFWGEPLSRGEVRGRAVHWGAESPEASSAPHADSLPVHEAERAQATVLVSEALSPALMLALPFVGGLVVKRGSPADFVAVMARALGVPAMAASRLPLALERTFVVLRVGSREASCSLPENPA